MLLLDIPGTGDTVRRQQSYRLRLRLWLPSGEPIRWPVHEGPMEAAKLEDDGATLITERRIDRRSLINGVFYGIDGMRGGGIRRLEIAPHLAYGDRGVPGIVPRHATLIAEVKVLPVRPLRD